MLLGKRLKKSFFLLVMSIFLCSLLYNMVYFSFPSDYKEAEVHVISPSGELREIKKLSEQEIHQIQDILNYHFYYKAPLLTKYQGTEVDYLIQFYKQDSELKDTLILNKNQTAGSRMIDRTRLNLNTLNSSVFLTEEQAIEIIKIIKEGIIDEF